MGIGYIDSIIVYNQYHTHGYLQKQSYFGTRFDNVRIELTQGANMTRTGTENASACIAKIMKENFPKPYIAPPKWRHLTTEEMLEKVTFSEGEDFYIIVKSKDFDIDIDLPVGIVESDNYEGYDGGFFEYLKTQFGFAYSLYKADSYGVIPYWALYGK